MNTKDKHPKAKKLLSDLIQGGKTERANTLSTLASLGPEEAAGLSPLLSNVCDADLPGKSRKAKDKHLTMVARGILDARPEWVNTPDSAFNFLPLHHAVSYGLVDLARLLLERGAEPHLETDTQQSPYSILPYADVRRNVALELYALMKELANPNPQQKATLLKDTATVLQDPDICRQLIADGADGPFIDGKTPVMALSNPLYIHGIETMADAGADFKSIDENGENALHHACSYIPEGELPFYHVADLKKTFALLLRNGCDPSQRNCHGKSPTDILWSKQRELSHWLGALGAEQTKEQISRMTPESTGRRRAARL